jgi:hypothetical protein
MYATSEKQPSARLGAKLMEIAEKDTPEKLEADIQRWLHGSN